LDQHLSLEPVMPGAEEARVAVPKGFDPAEVRLIGEARGEPPFRGTLRHHGWRVVDARLPALADGVDRAVIAPAEAELSRASVSTPDPPTRRSPPPRRPRPRAPSPSRR